VSLTTKDNSETVFAFNTAQITDQNINSVIILASAYETSSYVQKELYRMFKKELYKFESLYKLI
jgi:hypothetical protein